MQRKIAPRKLALSPAVIRHLSGVKLEDVVGGGTIFVSVCPACSDICPLKGSP